MRTYTSPGGVKVPPEANVVQQLVKRAGEALYFPALASPNGDGFTTVTTRELLDTVALGIGPGERVALRSGTRVIVIGDAGLFIAALVSLDEEAQGCKEFRLLTKDLSVKGGELTSMLKVRRFVVFAKCADLIDDIYG